MGWLLSILGWFTGGTLDRILSTVDKKFDNETERERIKAQVVEKHLETEVQALAIRANAFAGDKWVSLGRGAFVLTCWAYFTSIVVDSMFHLGWRIAALPSPYDTIVFTIVGAIFVTDSLKSIFKR